jgi:uncharacterized protein (DUF58 family)
MPIDYLKRATVRSATVLSTDFCPSLNRWVYWLKNPLWLLLLAVGGSIACGVMLNPMIFVLTAMLLVVVLVGFAFPFVAMKRISCELLFDVRRVSFGQPAVIRLRIKNRGLFPVYGLSLIDGFAITQDVEAKLSGDEGLSFGRIGARTTVEYSWSFVARQRGKYPRDGSARIETSFPFGLYRAAKVATCKGGLIVWPETTRLAGIPDFAECDTAEEQFSDRRVGDHGDVLGTRHFRQGDSLRRVHWAQTARQQTLIVTERQAPVTTVARIVLDLTADSHPPQTRATTVEQCIRAAASLCESLHAQQCHVELQFGDELFVGGRQSSGLVRLLDALAMAEVVDDSQKHSDRAQSSALRARRNSGVELLVTTWVDTRPTAGRRIVISEPTENSTFPAPDSNSVSGTTTSVDNSAGGDESTNRTSVAWIHWPANAELTDLSRSWARSL